MYQVNAGVDTTLDARVIRKIREFVSDGSFTVGEVRRRLTAWVRKEFPNAFRLGNTSFLPASQKISVHMCKYMLHHRYANIDEVNIDNLVSENASQPCIPSGTIHKRNTMCCR